MFGFFNLVVMHLLFEENKETDSISEKSRNLTLGQYLFFIFISPLSAADHQLFSLIFMYVRHLSLNKH